MGAGVSGGSSSQSLKDMGAQNLNNSSKRIGTGAHMMVRDSQSNSRSAMYVSELLSQTSQGSYIRDGPGNTTNTAKSAYGATNTGNTRSSMATKKGQS